MEAILQPGACWLFIVDNRCTVLRITASRDKCLFPGESAEEPLDRVQEWLTPVWSTTMLQCSQCLTQAAEKVQPGGRTNVREELRSDGGSPRPQSFWIASVNGHPDVLQVVENGIRLPGHRETYPLAHVKVWIMPVWSLEMAYCPGCAQAKPRRDMLFFFRGSPKGVCKDCSEDFDIEAMRETNHA
jgi:hypothetical protein